MFLVLVVVLRVHTIIYHIRRLEGPYGLLFFFSQLAKHVGKEGTNQEGSGQGIANGHGNQVARQGLPDRDGSATQESRGQQEHVGDGMFKANGDKGGNGQQDTKILACQILGLHTQVDGQADEPVAKHGADNNGSQGNARLVNQRLDGQIGRSARQDTGKATQNGKETAGNQVAQERKSPGSGQFADSRFLFADRRRHVGRIASKQLSAGLQGQQEIDGKQNGKHEFAQTGIQFGDTAHVAGNGQTQHATHSDIGTANHGRHERLHFAHVGIGGTLFGQDLKGRRRCFNHGDFVVINLRNDRGRGGSCRIRGRSGRSHIGTGHVQGTNKQGRFGGGGKGRNTTRQCRQGNHGSRFHKHDDDRMETIDEKAYLG